MIRKKVRLLKDIDEEYSEEYGLKQGRVFSIVDELKDIVWVHADNDKLVVLYKEEFVFV